MNAKGIINQEIELTVEEVEAVIAPATRMHNHNETTDIDLTVEEAEAVIAPAIMHE